MSVALARTYPDMDITMLDLPHIAKMAKDKFLPADLPNVHCIGGLVVFFYCRNHFYCIVKYFGVNIRFHTVKFYAKNN